MALEQSILTSTKKLLNIGADDLSFDQDVLIHINSAFSHLHQLGIGPEEGVVVTDASLVWDDVVDTTDPILSLLKTYIYLKVRMVFDPPQLTHVMAALKEATQEQEWRLSTMREAISWTPPPEEEEEELDGGELGDYAYPVIDGGEEGYT